MPYIKQGRRRELDKGDAFECKTPGELNYIFTCVVDDYVRNVGLSYQAINDVLASLEGAKLEFYRRVVVPYENVKLATNGDVYTGADDV